jgi:hypothetical protein
MAHSLDCYFLNDMGQKRRGTLDMEELLLPFLEHEEGTLVYTDSGEHVVCISYDKFHQIWNTFQMAMHKLNEWEALTEEYPLIQPQ